jgi:hypothetical protein
LRVANCRLRPGKRRENALVKFTNPVHLDVNVRSALHIARKAEAGGQFSLDTQVDEIAALVRVFITR